jgi:hypothetical protein
LRICVVVKDLIGAFARIDALRADFVNGSMLGVT